jgi:hypothetical protein
MKLFNKHHHVWVYGSDYRIRQCHDPHCRKKQWNHAGGYLEFDIWRDYPQTCLKCEGKKIQLDRDFNEVPCSLCGGTGLLPI